MQISDSAEPLVGTWKLNLEKSNYGALPAPKSDTATFAAQEDGLFKFAADGINSQGQAIHSECFTRLDGAECPVTGSPFMDTVVARRVDVWTTEWIASKRGKVVVTATEVVSRDGNTLTGAWELTDETGQTRNWTTVSDKQ
jgi:hypothetical protein